MATAQRILSKNPEEIPLIFVPGVKGSSLQDKNGKKVWVSPKQAFGLEDPHLDLPLEWYEVHNDPEDPDGHLRWRQMKDDIVPRKPISKVARFHIYGKWLKLARKLKRPYFEFAYDWRRDLNEGSHLFRKFLENVYEKHGPAQVVTHSMGGLVVFSVVNDPKYTHLFHNVLFAGSPFSQEIGFLFDMHAGVPNGFNNHILDPKVLFTCASGSAFYPFHDNPKVFVKKENVLPTRQHPEPDHLHTTMHSDQEIRHHEEFLRDHPDLAVFDVDFYDPNDWIQHKIGIFSMDYLNMQWKLPSGAKKEDTERILINHMSRSLHQAAHLRRRLRFDPNVAYPPMAMLKNSTHPTFARVLRDGPKAIRGFDFETLPKTEGDIRVSAASATLPRGIPCEEYTTEEEHAYLLDDPQVWRIMDKLNNYAGDPEWFHKTEITIVRRKVEGKTVTSQHREHVIRVL